MTKHLASPFTPAPITGERAVNNGMVPNAPLARRLAQGFNFVSCVQKRQLALYCQALNDVTAGGAGTDRTWSSFVRTSENTTGLTLAVGLAMSDYAGAPTAYFQIADYPSAGTTITVELDYTALIGSADVAPNDIAHRVHYITGLTPNTDYYCSTALVDGARLVYLSLVESMTRHADDTVTGVCNPASLVAESPVTGTQIADLVDANNKLWRHNGAHLFHWSVNYWSAPLTLTSTSYVNVIDATATVDTHSVGVKLFTTYHNTVNRTTVPVRMAVRAIRTVGAGTLDIKMTDGTNTVSITGITTSASNWFVGTGTIPPQSGTKWDVHAKVSAGIFEVFAVSLEEYEA